MRSSLTDRLESGKNSLDVPGTVLVDDWNADRGDGISYLFTEPRDVIVAESFEEVEKALQTIVRLQDDGRHLAGYISYEAGTILDRPMMFRQKQSYSSRQQECPKCNVPLVWLGVYDSFEQLNYDNVNVGEAEPADRITDIQLSVSDDEYLSCIKRIKRYIAAGDVYQVNYTCRIFFENTGTARGFFARMRKAHPVCHSAFVNTGEFQVVSLSPELFLRKTGNKLQARPMKGTVQRGRFVTEDRHLSETLSRSLKNRAENLMIVDLMRNDIGKICRYGSVNVPRLFHIEQFRSVFQMTSEVEGILCNNVDAVAMLGDTFPPGSVTGAPKIRAMEIIDELENAPRGIYCGSVGMFLANGDVLLNVAIRTVVQHGMSCELGIGSGIVADSSPKAELQETLLKSKFIHFQPDDFQLLETVLYRRGCGYTFLEEHLRRMNESARYFGRKFDVNAIRAALDNAAAEIETYLTLSEARVRLLVSNCGTACVEWSDLRDSTCASAKLLLANRQTDPNDIFLYHKTTLRSASDADLRAAREANYLDVLYTNTSGELTECAITNILVELDGIWYTPPIKCGLLPGIWRASALQAGRVRERVITPADLANATTLVVCNSVRGEIVVKAIDRTDEECLWVKTP